MVFGREKKIHNNFLVNQIGFQHFFYQGSLVNCISQNSFFLIYRIKSQKSGFMHVVLNLLSLNEKHSNNILKTVYCTRKSIITNISIKLKSSRPEINLTNRKNPNNIRHFFIIFHSTFPHFYFIRFSRKTLKYKIKAYIKRLSMSKGKKKDCKGLISEKSFSCHIKMKI